MSVHGRSVPGRSAQPKRIVIVPFKGAATIVAPTSMLIPCFKDQPVVDDNFFDVAWAKLQQAVTAIHKQLPVDNSPQTLFRGAPLAVPPSL